MFISTNVLHSGTLLEIEVINENVHLAGLGGDTLVVAILMLRVSAWKNAMGTINRCVASIDGAHGKTRATSLKGILSGCLLVTHHDESVRFNWVNHYDASS